ncbi:MAG: hypothetical protein E7172_02500 [Firmicutes bacterium]|nr:hypothetical protein [Bacillota bacterium]
MYQEIIKIYEQKLKYLSQIKEKNSLLFLSNHILKTEIEYLHNNSNNQKVPFTKELKDTLEIISKYKFMFLEIKNYFESIEKHIEIKKITYPLVNKEELFDICFNFIENVFPKNIKDQIINHYQHSMTIFHIPNYEYLKGETVYIPYLEESYIYLYGHLNFKMAMILIHEIAHSYHYLNNYMPPYNKNNCFCEIISLFFEFLFLNYYLDNLKYSDISKKLLIENFSFYNYYSIKINKLLKLYKKINYLQNKHNISLKEIIIKYIDDPNIIKVFNMNPKENYIYVFGYIIAIELFMIYLEDPNQAFLDLNKIIMIDGQLNPNDYFEEIKKIGITPTLNSKKFQKSLNL